MTEAQETTTEATPTPPPAEATPPEPTEPKGKAPLPERIAKAEAAVQRRKEQAARERAAREEIEAKYRSTASEYEKTRAEVERIRSLKERAADGDDEAIAELLGFDFDHLTRLKLQPEEAKAARQAKKGLTETEKKIQDLEAKLKAREEQEAAAAVEMERRYFLQAAEQLAPEMPDLEALDRSDLLALGESLAPAFFKEHGRPPTFPELARAVAEHVRPYHERIVAAYSKRKPTPPPAPAKKAASPGPSTVPASAASTSAAEQKSLSEEERREAAIRKAKELLGGS